MRREELLLLIDVAAKRALEQTTDDFGVTIGQLREKQFEIFATLIRAATKEEDARICEENPERQRGDGIYAEDQQACADAIRKSK